VGLGYMLEVLPYKVLSIGTRLDVGEGRM